MHELPLVFFTVFTQSAVGAFILLLIGGAMGLVAPRRKAIGLFSVMCLFGLGVIVGTFHVGQPLRALNMLLRVGHSPMSNEIVLSAAFAALGGLGALGLLLNRATPLCNALVWLAAIVGVVFLYAVPQIYQLPTVATWRSSYTTAMMILTPLIGGGALAAGVVGVVVCARLKSSAAVLAMTAVVVIAAELAGRIAFYNLWTLPM
ncbi:dimethyl sulfoxide reductase [Salmonella enterica subsp. enterica]|nr:dimethyl sulfoxide reductase [Salmonella enterica subsp. enterica]